MAQCYPPFVSFFESGYVGNVWLAQHHLPLADMEITGHAHSFDHASLLVQGRVKVQIEGEEWKEFQAPTFIVIRANLNHRIVALENDTIWYCVFAMRDFEGQVVSQYDPENAPPFNGVATNENYKELYEDLLGKYEDLLGYNVRLKQRLKEQGLSSRLDRPFESGAFGIYDTPHVE